MKSVNRASSLPPSCLPYEEHIYQLNVSLDVNSSQNICDTVTDMRSPPPGACTDYVSHCPEMLLHSVKVSPSDSSGITDEDSGYFQTNSTSSRQVGSNNSIATSGQLNYEGSGGFVNRDELLQVMTEDLVDWFIQMYPTQTEDLTVENFFDRLSDGVLLCHHVAELHQRLAEQCELSTKAGRTRLVGVRVGGAQALLPNRYPVYQTRGLNSTNATSAFVSRDNVSNFLGWCRQLGMPDCVLFESEDLVCRKNPRNVAVCLLELARLGGGVGMAVPELIQLEAEIDEEIACDSYDDDNKVHPTHSSSCSSITEQDRAVQAGTKSESSCRSVGTGMAIESARKLCNVNDQSCCHNDDVDDGDDDNDGNKYLSGADRNGTYRTTKAAELRLLRTKRLRSQSRSTTCAETKEAEDNAKRRPEIQRPVVDLRTLDEIVRDLLSQCTCKQTFPMIRLSEGRYLFGDKCTQIFVRILRNHVMVRVGGGWDTLNHFLAKYDECRKVNPPNCRVTNGTCQNNPSTPRSVDTTDPQSVLNALETTDSSTTLISNGPIRGEGKLTAVKKSPPLDECAVIQPGCPMGTNKHRPSGNLESAKSLTKFQKRPPQLQESAVRTRDNLSPEKLASPVDEQSILTNVWQAKPTSPTVKACSPVNSTKPQSIHHADKGIHSQLIRRTSKSILPDRFRASGISAEDGTKSSVHSRADAVADADRSKLGRRALASAPRTPVSNRSRGSSPGKITSVHSKSSSSLTSCGLRKNTSIQNRQIAQQTVRMSRRCSEQPTQAYRIRSSRENGSKPGNPSNTLERPSRKVTEQDEFPLDKLDLDENASFNECGTKENRVKSGYSSPKSRLSTGACENEPCEYHIQRTQTNERKPSLIPRLIRCRSASQIPSVTTVECDSLPDVL